MGVSPKPRLGRLRIPKVGGDVRLKPEQLPGGGKISRGISILRSHILDGYSPPKPDIGNLKTGIVPRPMDRSFATETYTDVLRRRPSLELRNIMRASSSGDGKDGDSTRGPIITTIDGSTGRADSGNVSISSIVREGQSLADFLANRMVRASVDRPQIGETGLFSEIVFFPDRANEDGVLDALFSSQHQVFDGMDVYHALEKLYPGRFRMESLKDLEKAHGHEIALIDLRKKMSSGITITAELGRDEIAVNVWHTTVIAAPKTSPHLKGSNDTTHLIYLNGRPHLIKSTTTGYERRRFYKASPDPLRLGDALVRFEEELSRKMGEAGLDLIGTLIRGGSWRRSKATLLGLRNASAKLFKVGPGGTDLKRIDKYYPGRDGRDVEQAFGRPRHLDTGSLEIQWAGIDGALARIRHSIGDIAFARLLNYMDRETLSSMIPTESPRYKYLTAGLEAAYDEVTVWASMGDKITLDDVIYLRDLISGSHNRLSHSDPSFRTRDKSVSIVKNPYYRASDGKHHFPSPSDVVPLLTQALDMINTYNGKLHPLDIAARIYQTVYEIQPFDNGNQRLAYSLSAIPLIRNGYPLPPNSLRGERRVDVLGRPTADIVYEFGQGVTKRVDDINHGSKAWMMRKVDDVATFADGIFDLTPAANDLIDAVNRIIDKDITTRGVLDLAKRVYGGVQQIHPENRAKKALAFLIAAKSLSLEKDIKKREKLTKEEELVQILSDLMEMTGVSKTDLTGGAKLYLERKVVDASDFEVDIDDLVLQALTDASVMEALTVNLNQLSRDFAKMQKSCEIFQEAMEDFSHRPHAIAASRALSDVLTPIESFKDVVDSAGTRKFGRAIDHLRRLTTELLSPEATLEKVSNRLNLVNSRLTELSSSPENRRADKAGREEYIELMRNLLAAKAEIEMIKRRTDEYDKEISNLEGVIRYAEPALKELYE